MGAQVFTLRLADGSTVRGAVHGSGGQIAGGEHNRERLRRAIRQAEKGRDTGLYQPKPGHALVYLDHDNVTTTDVNLRGAEVL